jgi:hypothetical protein
VIFASDLALAEWRVPMNQCVAERKRPERIRAASDALDRPPVVDARAMTP